MRRWVGAATLAAAMVSLAPAALAGSFDERGVLSLDGAVTEGFEDGSSFDITGFTNEGVRASAADMITDTPDGLEGSSALKMGAAVRQAVVRMDDATRDLSGRRVEMKMWIKPQGTDLRAWLVWRAGDEEAYLRGDYFQSAAVGYLGLLPTGRATSDGWREISTGPFDWELGSSLAPSWLTLFSDQHTFNFFTYEYDYSATQAALVDGIEIVDLGPAAIAPNACTLGTEADACGDLGICHMGRCVDSASVVGQLPPSAIRGDYIERLIEQVRQFNGARLGKESMDSVESAWRALIDAETPKAFWRGLSAGHEPLLDGHGSPPRNAFMQFASSAGICLGPGVADLLPGRAPDALVPMIFTTDAAFGTASNLQPGDVLTSIDGQDVWDWMEANRDVFYFNGDPAGRNAMLTSSIVSRAMATGSRLTFERCQSADGEACAEADVQTFEVDLGAWGTPIWRDELPEGLYASVDCDRRFAPVAAPSGNQEFYEFSAWRELDGIRHLVFNGFPSTYGRSGQRWTSAFIQGTTGSPDKIVIDQRTGYGGQVDSVNFLVGLLTETTNTMYASFVPWIEEEILELARDAADRCNAAVGRSDICGGFFDMIPNADFANGAAASAKVALVNGYDVSGNDYFSKFMTLRKAPTRIFGYGPTIGAYGVSCQMPGLINELSPMAYQCHDSTFTDRDGTELPFQSGIGVPADELVYQRQSDAIAGVDTALARATEWLNEEEN